ncbi:MAG: hypothetical protein JWP12_3583 [Bacteroidetes bacterium]|nr:hypothetical protein [Bacteroidota bacterium]
MNPHNNDHDEEFDLPAKGKQHSFVVPDGYFEKLSDRIMARIELEAEMEEFALLASIKKEPQFEIPADYFKAAENELEYKHELSEFEALAKIGKPVLKEEAQADYFAALDEKVLKRMEITEELSEYSTLAALEKENNFAVNAHYFETVADRVKEKYRAQQQRTSVFGNVFAFLLKPRVAFTYSVMLIIGAGVFYNNSKQKEEILPTVSGDCKTLACLEKREMLNDHTIREMNTDDLYDMVDVDALDKRLSADSLATDSLAVQLKNMDSLNKK